MSTCVHVSLTSEFHAQITLASSIRYFCFVANRRRSDSRSFIEQETKWLSLDDLFTRSFLKFTEIVTYNEQFRPKSNTFFFRGYRQDRIRHQHDPYYRMRCQMLSSLIFRWTRVLDSDCNDPRDRLQSSVRYRFARIKRDESKFPDLLTRLAFPPCNSFMTYKTKLDKACISNRTASTCICSRQSTLPGQHLEQARNGRVRCSTLNRRTASTGAFFARQGQVPGDVAGVQTPYGDHRRMPYRVNLWEHLATFQCHRCRVPTKAVCTAQERVQPNRNRKFLLYIKCMNNTRNGRNRDLSASISVFSCCQWS